MCTMADLNRCRSASAAAQRQLQLCTSHGPHQCADFAQFMFIYMRIDLPKKMACLLIDITTCSIVFCTGSTCHTPDLNLLSPCNCQNGAGSQRHGCMKVLASQIRLKITPLHHGERGVSASGVLSHLCMSRVSASVSKFAQLLKFG